MDALSVALVHKSYRIIGEVAAAAAWSVAQQCCGCYDTPFWCQPCLPHTHGFECCTTTGRSGCSLLTSDRQRWITADPTGPQWWRWQRRCTAPHGTPHVSPRAGPGQCTSGLLENASATAMVCALLQVVDAGEHFPMEDVGAVLDYWSAQCRGCHGRSFTQSASRSIAVAHRLLEQVLAGWRGLAGGACAAVAHCSLSAHFQLHRLLAASRPTPN